MGNFQNPSQTRRDVLHQVALTSAARASWAAAVRRADIAFQCAADNDLYRAVSAYTTCPRYGSPSEAIEKAPRGAAVLLLADSYPSATNPVSADIFANAAAKRLRVYVEFPSAIPGFDFGPPKKTVWERGVVASDAFGPSLQRLRIVAIHDCHFVPVFAARADLVIARVAGFDTAVYGLPEKDVYPILFEHPSGNVMVATTKLSQFVTARYAPSDAWTAVWNRVLQWLAPDRAVPRLSWIPSVRPAFGKSQRLPADVELQAFTRGVSWYDRAGLLLPRGNSRDKGIGGVEEGFGSKIRTDGRQPVQTALRNDCIGETSFAMALGRRIGKNAQQTSVAGNLNDFIYFKSVLAQGPRADPQSASFGLVGWTYPDSVDAYYGDDNARSMLGTIGAAALLNSDRWDRLVLRCMLANLRTTGKLGFRGNRLDEKPLQQNGWRHYFNGERINYAPHYEAYLWACFLWAYHKSRYRPFLEKARNAIRMTVEAYPGQWHWTNGIQQERARMLLPLAWLVRLEDTAEHRGWLRKIAAELLSFQDPCGAIREELGSAGKGDYAPPKSNEKYGTAEATLIQANGDPVCDLLYTTNFAFLGLHEAAAATRDRFYADAAEKLAKFLCRIQIRSEAHPELDGGWFRAFEFRRWDYWASNADLGWGVWSIETGWTQAWIASVLGMRHLGTSLWDLTTSSKIGAYLQELLPQMLPDERA